MSDLFLPTLEMMGLTFAIGFFVAFIIKLIASAADSLDFYSSHQQELLRLHRIKSKSGYAAVHRYSIRRNSGEHWD